MNQKKTATVIVLIVIVIVLAFFGYRALWSWLSEQNTVDDAALKEEATKLNPFNQETINPFEETANPYENIKVKPFE